MTICWSKLCAAHKFLNIFRSFLFNLQFMRTAESGFWCTAAFELHFIGFCDLFCGLSNNDWGFNGHHDQVVFIFCVFCSSSLFDLSFWPTATEYCEYFLVATNFFRDTGLLTLTSKTIAFRFSCRERIQNIARVTNADPFRVPLHMVSAVALSSLYLLLKKAPAVTYFLQKPNTQLKCGIFEFQKENFQTIGQEMK